ncbi:MAG TPA: TetR family transcriptional regulator [Streptosporangiaceae bacterium]|nr:TetR family transcriptional regulator [Streptosporangiaceae bacterium]
MARSDSQAKGHSQAERARRAPSPEERQRDAARSRERLLAAALDEFSARGFAGARVSAIADRAGLNPQLITYYFGGKEGLYRAIGQRWLEQEATFAAPESPLGELIAAYMRASFADARMSRLLLWDGLTDKTDEEGAAAPGDEREDLSDLERRQTEGEIAADLDPGLLQLALMGATLAPIALPQVVRRITGRDPGDPRFQADYIDQIRRIIRHLSGPKPA